MLVAAVVALLAWLNAAKIFTAPTGLMLLLAGYGFLHAIIASCILMFAEKGSAGIGSVLTAVAFAGMLLLEYQQFLKPTNPQV